MHLLEDKKTKQKYKVDNQTKLTSLKKKTKKKKRLSLYICLNNCRNYVSVLGLQVSRISTNRFKTEKLEKI